LRVHILVTNDDGVHAPGLAALTRAAAGWMALGDAGEDRSVTVVAPLSNHSGASAAVGSVFERERIPSRVVAVPGAEEVPAYGVDASPSLSVIVAGLGAFGPRPDVVLSGINLGVNVGRSILHSGTVGAVLTAAQLGLSGLAVSLRSDAVDLAWDTAADLALRIVPELSMADAVTSLNLNVPSIPLAELRGVRHGHIGTARVIRSASDTGGPAVKAIPRPRGASHSGRPSGVVSGTTGQSVPGSEGHLVLELGAAVPALGDVADEDPGDDAALVANGFASLTPLAGVRESHDESARQLVERILTHCSHLG
jgi:5'-nucleotidase